jgi:hypothetical protein
VTPEAVRFARLALTPQPAGIKPEARPEVPKTAEPKSGPPTNPEDARTRFGDEMSEAVRFLTEKEMAERLTLLGMTIRCATAVAKRDGREPPSEPTVRHSPAERWSRRARRKGNTHRQPPSQDCVNLRSADWFNR